MTWPLTTISSLVIPPAEDAPVDAIVEANVQSRRYVLCMLMLDQAFD